MEYQIWQIASTATLLSNKIKTSTFGPSPASEDGENNNFHNGNQCLFEIKNSDIKAYILSSIYPGK